MTAINKIILSSIISLTVLTLSHAAIQASAEESAAGDPRLVIPGTGPDDTAIPEPTQTPTPTPIPANPANESATLVAPVTSASATTTPEAKKVNAIFKVTSSETGRILGGIKLKLDGKDIGEVPDPPSQSGLSINNIAAGKFELIAQRTLGGYEVYDENITISADKSNYTFSIKMKLINSGNKSDTLGSTTSNTSNSYTGGFGYPPSVSDPTGALWWPTSYTGNGTTYPTNTGTYGYGSTSYNCGGITGQTCQSGYRCVYSSYGGVVPSDAMGKCVPESAYNNGQTPYIGYPSTGSYTYPNTYDYTTNSNLTIPVVSSYEGTNLSNLKGQSVRFVVLETANQSVPVTQNTIVVNDEKKTFYTCLKANTDYIIRIDSPGTNLDPIYHSFRTPTQGNYLLSEILSLSFDDSTANISDTSGKVDNTSNVALQCPRNSYNNMPSNTPVRLSDSTIDSRSLLSGNFKIERDPQTGGYFLVNSKDRRDIRRIYFVRISNTTATNGQFLEEVGHRGFGFFSADPETYYSGNYYNDSMLDQNKKWYVFGYQTDQNGDNLEIINNQMSLGNMSPATYSNIIKGQFANTYGLGV